MAALTTRQISGLSRREQEIRATVRNRLTATTTSMWTGMGSWRDRDVDQFVERVLPVVRGARATVAQSTDAYVATVADSTPVGAMDVTNIRGVPDEDVYRRPAVSLYTALFGGAPLSTAQDMALTRLASLVTTDLQLSMQKQARRTLAPSGVDMYQRTLTGMENCALCTIASTQRYWKKDLLPIHPGCDCGIAPWRGENVQVINDTLLEQVHAEVASHFGDTDRGARVLPGGDNPISDYLDLIVVRDHGELGPTLTWASHKFTGPADLH